MQVIIIIPWLGIEAIDEGEARKGRQADFFGRNQYPYRYQLMAMTALEYMYIVYVTHKGIFQVPNINCKELHMYGFISSPSTYYIAHTTLYMSLDQGHSLAVFLSSIRIRAT